MHLCSKADADDEDLFLGVLSDRFAQSSNPWLGGVVDGGRTARNKDGIETVCLLH